MRILIVGSHGQLARELQRSFRGYGEIVAAGRECFDLADENSTRELVRRLQPQIILNAAAYTAVDRAESEPELAMALNAAAPGVLAEEARKLDALFVHYSTDYVFDGSGQEPWAESAAPNPLNVYGRSKLAGEAAVDRAGGKTLIFRTSWVYGPHGSNFLLTMLRLGKERDEISVVDDQYGAPTSSSALAAAAFEVVRKVMAGECGPPAEWAGVYHMSCGGAVAWRGFADAIFARSLHLLGGRRPRVKPIPSSAYPTPAARPKNSVLSNAKLKTRFDVQLPGWEKALDQVITELSCPAQ